MSVVSNNILAGASGQGGAGYEIERSLRFNKPDGAHLDRTPSSQGNRRKFTWSGWVKRNEVGNSESALFSAGNNPWFDINFRNDKLTVVTDAGISGTGARTEAVYRDVSAWYHVVCVVNTEESTANDRIKFWVNGVRQTTTDNGYGYPAQNLDTIVNTTIAHRISADGRVAGGGIRHANIQLADVHFIDGQALAPTDFGKTDNNGVWQPKKFAGTYGTNGFHLPFTDNSSNAALGTDTSGNSNTWTVNNLSANDGAAPSKTLTRVRFKTDWNWMYVSQIKINGSALTTGTLDNPGNNTWSNMGGWKNGSTGSGNETYSQSARGDWFDVTLASSIASFSSLEIFVYLDSSSGTTTNIFEIELFYSDGTSFTKAYAANSDAPNQANGAFNYRQWQNFANLGLDPSTIDSLRDSPSQIADQTDTGAGGEVVGNYATWNPLAQTYSTLPAITDGNLTEGPNAGGTVLGTIAVSSGKWFWEITVDTTGGALVGAASINGALTTNQPGYFANSASYIRDGRVKNNGSDVGTYATYGAGDIIGVALDMDNGVIKFYKNNTLIVTISSNISGTWTPAVADYNGSGSVLNANFGQRAFAYTAPSGYKSLNTANLPTPTIADGSKYFDTKLYTGDGNSSNAQTGLKFSPDFAWVKPRSAASSHNLYDTIRGDNKRLVSNATSAEQTVGFEFDSNGFDPTGSNDNGTTYVTWAWDAGSSNTTIAAGSLNSSAYNQSTDWSSGASNANMQNAWSTTFDGDTSNFALPNTGYASSLTFSSAISYATLELVVTRDSSAPDLLMNGSALNVPATNTSNNGGQYKLERFNFTNGTLTSIGHQTRTIVSQGGSGFYQIIVDGKILVNSGVTPPNVPSIASTVRANPSAGFSICTYTGNGSSGASIGHGLNDAPAFVVVKNRNLSTQGWCVYHSSIGATKYVQLNTTSAAASYGGTWNNTSPTSSVFTVGNDNIVNQNNSTYVAYCFSSVAGYSAMGSYVGNGSADGPFVALSFRPAFLLVKAFTSGSAEHWYILDSVRNTSNVVDKTLFPSLSNAEDTDSANNFDFLSNGFKLRNTNAGFNYSGRDYLYYAVAENPFQANGGLAR